MSVSKTQGRRKRKKPARRKGPEKIDLIPRRVRYLKNKSSF
jgi:hypothetical protein